MSKKYEITTKSPTSSKVTIRPIGTGSIHQKEKNSLTSDQRKNIK